MTPPRGRVTFVGAGCGDPRLLTLRGAEVLARADFVLHDADVHPDTLARIREGAARQAMDPSLSPEAVATRLAREAQEGRHAVRLASGDPLLFGRADAQAAALATHGVEVEVVPGIGPLLALGAFTGIALTRSSDPSPSVAVASVTQGHETLHDWAKLATGTDTLVIEADRESVADIARSLVFHGRSPDEPVTLAMHVSLPSQQLTETTLGQVPLLPAPTSARVLLVAGEHARPSPALGWFAKLPLAGKRVLVTRAREQGEGAASLLRERGAEPVVVPTIEIHPPADARAMEEAVAALGDRYDWVVLTSANGVLHLLGEVARQGKDARAFGRAKIAAIGPGTAAALQRAGLVADVVAKEHRQEGLVSDILAAMGGRPARVLLARAEVARELLPAALRAAGCEVDVVPVYATRMPARPLLDALAAQLEAGAIDVVTFTSSSTVEHLCDALEGRAAALLARCCVASIGPITTETAQRRGVRVDVTAAASSLEGLVAALEKHFAKPAWSRGI
ncbi:MAG: Uroporphyrinogen-III methyltransferase [Labilithrix sp.]|nr:Uroporphyrinogen-III methyltransferase [Labilithrix sp.]